MTEVAQALNEVQELYTKFLGQQVPDVGPGWYAQFPPGADPVRFAVQEVEELKRLLMQTQALPAPVAWVPRADMYAGKNALILRVEVPGSAREEIKVLVAEGECIVRGDRHAPKKEDGLRPLGLELPYGTFERRFRLPLHADAAKLTAKIADGVLELTIPIAEAAAPREMKVEVK